MVLNNTTYNSCISHSQKSHYGWVLSMAYATTTLQNSHSPVPILTTDLWMGPVLPQITDKRFIQLCCVNLL